MTGYGLGTGSVMGLGTGALDWLVMLGGMLLIIAVVVLVARQVGQGEPSVAIVASPSAGPDAEELLRRRFARGEISSAEYLDAQQTMEAGR